MLPILFSPQDNKRIILISVSGEKLFRLCSVRVSLFYLRDVSSSLPVSSALGGRNRPGPSSANNSLTGGAEKVGGKRLHSGGAGKPPHKPGSYPDPQKLAGMGKNTEPSEAAQKLLQKVKAKQEVSPRDGRECGPLNLVFRHTSLPRLLDPLTQCFYILFPRRATTIWCLAF